MAYAVSLLGRFGRGAGRVTVMASALAFGAAALSLPAVAQAPAAKKEQPKAPAKPAAAAKDKGKDSKAAAAPAGKQSAWVKLCEAATFNKKDKDGKEAKESKSICLTHHERLDGNTGMVLVSAAIRQVEGSDKQHLMVMVPLGMALPPGLRAAVYNKDQWEKASKNESIDEKALKPIELKYALCHPAGCTAEIEATPQLVDEMKAGGGLMILAINASAQPVGFPVPLDGFTEAYAGKPVDNQEYAKARGQLMAQIRQRQAELMEKFKAEKMKELPPQPGGGETGSAPAAKAPPAKK